MATPAKRVQDMTAEERLESLKAWAEEQKYVRPGEGGTLSGGGRAMPTLVFSSTRNLNRLDGQYTAPIGPPSYAMAMKPAPEKKRRLVGKLLGRMKEKRIGESSEGAVGGSSGVAPRLNGQPPQYSR